MIPRLREGDMSALDSGLDVVIEVSADYIDRIIREKFRRIGRICFENDEVTITRAGQAFVVAVRRVVPAIDSVWLSGQPVLDSFQTTANVRLRLLYGQVRHELLTHNEWKTLDELELEDEDRLFTFSGVLSAWPEVDRVLLIIDPSLLPDWTPQDLRDLLEEPIPIPLDFLQQRRTYMDHAGQEQTLTLLNSLPQNVVVKVVDGSNLAIGIDLELSQDADPKEVRPGADEERVLPDDLVPHTCGLPDQTDVLVSDLQTFFTGFTESFLQDSDWAVALDASVVDAMLRGLSSAGMNREGREPEENCDHPHAARRFCLKLAELQDGLIRISGQGQVFICKDQDPVDLVPNDWYEVCLKADVILSITEPPRRRLSGHYTLTGAELCGSDSDLDCCVDALEEVPDEFREGAIRLADVPTRFGDPDDPAGELEMEAVEPRTNGLVLRGSGSIRSRGRPILEAPETVLLATGCDSDEGPYTRTFSISNSGGVSLHICPLVIREVEDEDPDSAFTNAGLFTVTRPARLADRGQGATLRRDGRQDVIIQLDGEPGQRYTALLDIPNNTGTRTIKLIGDLRPASVAALPETLFIEHVDYERACHQGYPPARPIRERFEVTNEGPGNLQICEIEFPTNPSNPDGDPVFYGSGHPYMAEGETGTVNVIFVPGESGVDTTFRGRMRLVTNAGDHTVGLVGQLEHSVDERLAGVLGSFDSDVFCGDADWDAVQDSGGAILDVKQAGEFLSFLGGDPCCPPPKGPACLCVDLWEAAFQDVPPGVELEILDGAGSVIATNQARFRTRILIVPIREKNGYALRARVPQTVGGGKSSPVLLRRWVAQQDGLYKSGVPLTDLAALGSYAYAAGPSGLDVVNLKDPLRPVRAAQITHMAGVTSLSALGKQHLLAAEGGLKVFDLANPEQPKAIGSLPLTPGIRAVFATRVGGKNLAVACGPAKRLHVLDLSDPAHPEELGSTATHVSPGRLLARGSQGVPHGQGGDGAVRSVEAEAAGVGRAPEHRARGAQRGLSRILCRARLRFPVAGHRGHLEAEEPARSGIAADGELGQRIHSARRRPRPAWRPVSGPERRPARVPGDAPSAQPCGRCRSASQARTGLTGHRSP
jgi:hypothetical protein